MKKDPTSKPRYIKLLVVLATVMGFIVIGGFFFVQNRIHHFDSVEKEINEINKFLAEAENEKRQYELKIANGAKPILSKEVDQVQNDFIQKLNSYQLSISEIGLLSKPNNPPPKGAAVIPGIEYQLTMTGSWEMSMKYLNEMQNGPVLVNIRGIQMENMPKTNMLRTSLKYKIYTEVGG